jgi:TetR/AcrR family transcriptional regulator, regulator of autoinduction and epiphytic fitness
MTSNQATDSARREQVLSVALGVFGRYGFRKTSMDEVARSADISRQGLYFYFESKEALFRAAVRQELDTALTEVAQSLDDESVAVDDRVVAALDAWQGRYVGSMLASDVGNLLDHSAMQLGEMVTEFGAAFQGLLSATIAAATPETDRRQLGVTPEEIAGMLNTLARGWKREVDSRPEFVARMTGAVRLVFAAFTPHTNEAP